jgi:Amt family ammonium transporter
MENLNLLDTLWVLVAALLVFFMNAGFAFLESGFVRAKNTVNVLAKNFVVFGLATVSFWIIGYTLMFKGNLSALFFSDVAAVTGGEGHKIPEVVFFFFQLAFAATAASIVSGAVVERIKLISYIVFSLLLVAFIYPVIGLATWGGGFLSELGFVDFAGSTVVHSVGGWAALAGIILLGARREKFKGGRINVIPGHSMPLATLGTFILWLGWFGFNPGSQLAMDGMVPVIAVNTNLAAVFGMLTATVLSWAKFGKPDFAMILNGLLGGLVAITAGCAAVNFGSAAIIGTIAGAVVFFGVPFFERMKLDDPVGVTSVHLLCGIAGTFLVGFFATDGGLFYGGGIDLILKQLAGIGFTGGVVFFGSLFLWYIIKITMGLRVSDKEEMEGLDYGEMGYEAYMFTETK